MIADRPGIDSFNSIGQGLGILVIGIMFLENRAIWKPFSKIVKVIRLFARL